jgi:benzoyl-CoA reductase/2-hydroxyglutaryl-CoA dehydratase subunit BcrC/BadD/HgdB
MIDVLADLRDELSAAFGKAISDEQLRLAIQTQNRIRGILERIASFRSRHPRSLPGADLYHILKAAMVMDREELPEVLEALYEELTAADPEPGEDSRKRILLTGGICSHPDIYTLIEDAGADVVWDDLCTGTRYFKGLVDDDGDPVEALADRYMARMVCPAKHTGMNARGRYLSRIASEQKIDGAVFLLLKFCDPHGFDYPYLKSFLEEAGVATLLLEVEDRLPSEAQLRTRFETFVDML